MRVLLAGTRKEGRRVKGERSREAVMASTESAGPGPMAKATSAGVFCFCFSPRERRSSRISLHSRKRGPSMGLASVQSPYCLQARCCGVSGDNLVVSQSLGGPREEVRRKVNGRRGMEVEPVGSSARGAMGAGRSAQQSPSRSARVRLIDSVSRSARRATTFSPEGRRKSEEFVPVTSPSAPRMTRGPATSERCGGGGRGEKCESTTISYRDSTRATSSQYEFPPLGPCPTSAEVIGEDGER
ncbi:hypothetical protein KM043_001431 [Ampulex compressa]|nr:hypothetical protein KM043_001431 [Ampulex compressa]